ncbi:MAG TPA: ATP-dependent sacrificial sulfur transferase LarE [Abditibacteriaceae bacterium]
MIQHKEAKLRETLRSFRRILIAYSGGVDSAYLLSVARAELGDNAVAVIGVSPSLMAEELSEARDLAVQLGIPLREIETHEIDDANYAANPNNRCYFCKSHLFDALQIVAEREGFDAVCDGTNTDDMNEWRPGAQAGTERNIRSPLREADLNKAEIRELSRAANLPTWDKPAMPCLSSRIPYGTAVTREALQMVGKTEGWLRERGIREVRVRHIDANGTLTARIEAAPNEMAAVFALREELAPVAKAAGYDAVVLDLEGYRRGRLNDKIAPQPIALHF